MIMSGCCYQATRDSRYRATSQAGDASAVALSLDEEWSEPLHLVPRSTWESTSGVTFCLRLRSPQLGTSP